MSTRIIRPVGKPVKRIQVDIDAAGQVQVTGNQQGPLGQAVPMTMFEVCVLLANVVASTLMAMGGKIPMQTKTPEIEGVPNGDEKDEAPN